MKQSPAPCYSSYRHTVAFASWRDRVTTHTLYSLAAAPSTARKKNPETHSLFCKIIKNSDAGARRSPTTAAMCIITCIMRLRETGLDNDKRGSIAITTVMPCGENFIVEKGRTMRSSQVLSHYPYGLGYYDVYEKPRLIRCARKTTTRLDSTRLGSHGLSAI